MIQTQKRQLSKIVFFFIPVLLLLHILSAISLFKKSLIFIILVYGLVSLILFLISRKNRNKVDLLTIKKQDLLEKMNLLEESINKEKALVSALEKKNSRYALLKQALDKFNQTLILEDLGETVVEESFALFGKNSTIIVYLINRENNKLEVLSSRKVNSDIIIKEKHGDVFDEWVLKHNQVLLIEDTKSRDEFLFFSADQSEKNEEIQKFYKMYDSKRKEKKLIVRGIAPKKIRYLFKNRKRINMKYVDFPIPENVGLCNDKMAIITWENKPKAILITSKQIVKKQRLFFNNVWMEN